MANPIEAMKKYCDRCKYKGECWRPCPIVLAEILFGKSEDH